MIVIDPPTLSTPAPNALPPSPPAAPAGFVGVPSAPTLPLVPIARLFEIVSFDRVTFPATLSTPPPVEDKPLRIVTPEIRTLPLRISKTRSSEFPSITGFPEPLIVRSPLMSRSPLAPPSSLCPAG